MRSFGGATTAHASSTIEARNAEQREQRDDEQRDVHLSSCPDVNNSSVTYGKTPKLHKYQMPKRYAVFISDLMRKSPEIDRSDAREMMLNEFEFTGKQLPCDFSTEEQVRRRITGIKYRLEKKKRHYSNDGV